MHLEETILLFDDRHYTVIQRKTFAVMPALPLKIVHYQKSFLCK